MDARKYLESPTGGFSPGLRLPGKIEIFSTPAAIPILVSRS